MPKRQNAITSEKELKEEKLDQVIEEDTLGHQLVRVAEDPQELNHYVMEALNSLKEVQVPAVLVENNGKINWEVYIKLQNVLYKEKLLSEGEKTIDKCHKEFVAMGIDHKVDKVKHFSTFDKTSLFHTKSFEQMQQEINEIENSFTKKLP